MTISIFRRIKRNSFSNTIPVTHTAETVKEKERGIIMVLTEKEIAAIRDLQTQALTGKSRNRQNRQRAAGW